MIWIPGFETDVEDVADAGFIDQGRGKFGDGLDDVDGGGYGEEHAFCYAANSGIQLGWHFL